MLLSTTSQNDDLIDDGMSGLYDNLSITAQDKSLGVCDHQTVSQKH